MKKFSPTIKKLLLVTLCLVVVIAADYILFSSIKQKTAEVNATIDQNNTLMGEQDQASSFKTLYQNSIADRASLDSYILKSSDQVAFVEELGTLGKLAGVTLTIGGLGTSKDPASPIDVQFFNASLQVQGTWAQVNYFLQLVEALPYSLAVNTLELEQGTSASGKVDQWNGSFNISVLAYEQ